MQDDPEAAPPADFVRTSMSVPFFFRPFVLPVLDAGTAVKLPNAGTPAWQSINGFTGPVPDTAVFVDGGTLSNFPIALFHKPPPCLLPTLGIQLGADRDKAAKVDTMFDLIGQMDSTSRHLSDREFLFRNADYANLIGVSQRGALRACDLLHARLPTCAPASRA